MKTTSMVGGKFCANKISYNGKSYECGHSHSDGLLLCKSCADLCRSLKLKVRKDK